MTRVTRASFPRLFSAKLPNVQKTTSWSSVHGPGILQERGHGREEKAIRMIPARIMLGRYAPVAGEAVDAKCGER